MNTLSFRDGRIEGENTDAPGLLDAIGEPVAGRRALVLGAGGAGRAAAWALRDAGAEVCVWNRTAERAAALADELGLAARRARPRRRNRWSTPPRWDSSRQRERAGGARRRSGSMPAGAAGARSWTWSTAASRTALVRWAERGGARAVDGLEVLVRQGARSLALWTGAEPPVEVMKKAARHG